MLCSSLRAAPTHNRAGDSTYTPKHHNSELICFQPDYDNILYLTLSPYISMIPCAHALGDTHLARSFSGIPSLGVD